MEIFGVPVQALMGQLLIGLINGSFYALLSLGLAVIFGMLNIINFAHGAQYMMGAFAAYLLLEKLGLSYWWSLLVVPLLIGAFGMLIERTMLKPLYKLDHIYGLLLTFGLALILEGLFRNEYGASGLPYAIPPQLGGGTNLPRWRRSGGPWPSGRRTGSPAAGRRARPCRRRPPAPRARCLPGPWPRS